MIEYKSIKVSAPTMRWLKRLRGILEHGRAESISLDSVILLCVIMKDYEITKSLKLTKSNESIDEYILRINESLEIMENRQMIEDIKLIGQF